jgi:hypothetical protein
MHIGAISVKKEVFVNRVLMKWWKSNRMPFGGHGIAYFTNLALQPANLCLLHPRFHVSSFPDSLGNFLVLLPVFFFFLFFVLSWIWSCFLFYVPDSRTINFNCIGLFYDLPLFVFYDSLYLTSYKYVSNFFFSIATISHNAIRCIVMVDFGLAVNKCHLSLISLICVDTFGLDS